MMFPRLYETIIEPVVLFALPALCIVCNSPLEYRRKVICQPCFAQILPITTPYVEALKDEIEDKHFNELYIAYQFDDTFQKLIHLLKYKRSLTLATYFATSLAQIISEDYDLMAAVPLNIIKERERGYNQSNLIAAETARILHISFEADFLLRSKNTVSQTKLNKQERFKNIHQAFAIKRDVRGKKVLLVDDVITTGSTLNECARVLKESGADQVGIAALATPVNYLQKELEIGSDQLQSI